MTTKDIADTMESKQALVGYFTILVPDGVTVFTSGHMDVQNIDWFVRDGKIDFFFLRMDLGVILIITLLILMLLLKMFLFLLVILIILLNLFLIDVILIFLKFLVWFHRRYLHLCCLGGCPLVLLLIGWL